MAVQHSAATCEKTVVANADASLRCTLIQVYYSRINIRRTWRKQILDGGKGLKQPDDPSSPSPQPASSAPAPG
jgi:hypothetical protein